MVCPGDDPSSPPPPPQDSRLRVEAFILAAGPQLLAYITKTFPPAIRASYDPIDVYQTTVFEAFRRSGSFTYVSDAATMSWLKLMARRQIGMALRQERRHTSPHVDEAGGDVRAGRAAHLLAEYGQYLRTPSKSAIRHELLRAVEQAMLVMPPYLRDAVKHRHVDGMSMAEVATMLGRSESAVATLCYRGLRLLHRKLRGHEGV